MSEKNKLAEAIIKANEQFNLCRDELNRLQKQYKKYEVQEMENKYKNTYWIYKNNCFSCPETEEDYWDVFYYVKDINKNGWMEVIKFSLDKNNDIKIEQETMYPGQFEYLEQIERLEIGTAWQKIKQMIDKFEFNIFG